ncbi:hypothetical protein [Sorangium sp. So ce1097]|uniref:hypothetical protein n=1 Tax=Sorangium sp. So ce1097 TaxID=3133330 RepID=UPI003F62D2EF
MSDKREGVQSDGEGYERGSGLLAGPDMEIDPGYFIVKQNGQQVGRAYAIRRGEEHWELFTGYRWPSKNSGPVTLVIEPMSQGVPADDDAFRRGIRQGSVYLHLMAVKH